MKLALFMLHARHDDCTSYKHSPDTCLYAFNDRLYSIWQDEITHSSMSLFLRTSVNTPSCSASNVRICLSRPNEYRGPHCWFPKLNAEWDVCSLHQFEAHSKITKLHVHVVTGPNSAMPHHADSIQLQGKQQDRSLNFLIVPLCTLSLRKKFHWTD